MLNFDNSVVTTHIAGTVDKEIWFCSISVKPFEYWMGRFIDLAIQTKLSFARPKKPHLMIKLIAIDSLAVDRSKCSRYSEIKILFSDIPAGICKHFGKLFHEIYSRYSVDPWAMAYDFCQVILTAI